MRNEILEDFKGFRETLILYLCRNLKNPFPKIAGRIQWELACLLSQTSLS